MSRAGSAGGNRTMVGMRLRVDGPDGSRWFTLNDSQRPFIAGRDARADIPLPDPERLLSRQHLSLHRFEDRVRVRVLSTSGGALTSRGPLRPGEECLLAADDHLVLGAYRLHLLDDSAASAEAQAGATHVTYTTSAAGAAGAPGVRADPDPAHPALAEPATPAPPAAPPICDIRSDIRSGTRNGAGSGMGNGAAGADAALDALALIMPAAASPDADSQRQPQAEVGGARADPLADLRADRLAGPGSVAGPVVGGVTGPAGSPFGSPAFGPAPDPFGLPAAVAARPGVYRLDAAAPPAGSTGAAGWPAPFNAASAPRSSDAASPDPLGLLGLSAHAPTPGAAVDAFLGSADGAAAVQPGSAWPAARPAPTPLLVQVDAAGARPGWHPAAQPPAGASAVSPTTPPPPTPATAPMPPVPGASALSPAPAPHAGPTASPGVIAASVQPPNAAHARPPALPAAPASPPVSSPLAQTPPGQLLPGAAFCAPSPAAPGDDYWDRLLQVLDRASPPDGGASALAPPPSAQPSAPPSPPPPVAPLSPAAAAASAPLSTAPPSPSPPSSAVSSAPSSDMAQALAALAEGLELPLPAALDASQWRRLGAMLRLLLQGHAQLAAARAALKAELRVGGRTEFAGRDDNPLKARLPEAERLRLMLLGDEDGRHLPATQAIVEVTRDLQVHNLAIVHASRACIEGMVGSFDPRQWQQQQQAAGSEPLLRQLAEARLWRGYVAQYASQSQHLADWLDRLYDQHFVSAYAQAEARFSPSS